MANPQAPNPSTESTEQALQNLTFDKDFNVLAVELLGFDGTNLTRIQVTTDGSLKLS